LGKRVAESNGGEKRVKLHIGLLSRKFIVGLIIAILAFCAVSIAVPSVAGAATGWSKTYGGTGNETGGYTIQTSDGGYASYGGTNSSGAGGRDFWLFKVDAAGNLLWSKTYGGALNEDENIMCQTSDGGYAMVGYTASFGAVGLDVYLVKVDANGNMQWNKTYGGTGNDYGYSVIQTSDGGYAVGSYTSSFGTSEDIWLIKTDANGNMQWNKTYGGTGNEEGVYLIQTSDGGYTCLGYTNSFGAGAQDGWLFKTDASGNMQWNKTYGGTGNDYTYSLSRTSDGGYVMSGYTTSFVGFKVYLVKTDASGNMQWNKAYGGNATSVLIGIGSIQTADGGYAISGWNYFNGQDFILIKTDAAGNMQWNMTYGGPGLDDGYGVLQSSDGGYVLTGYTNSFGHGGYDVWLIKTDASGVMASPPSQPAATAFTSVTVLPGWTWYFFVHSNGGTYPYTYQWYEAGTLMQGQTSMVLSVTKTTPGTYWFYCKVTDAQGMVVASNSVTMIVMG
jgi:hypothetical protein